MDAANVVLAHRIQSVMQVFQEKDARTNATAIPITSFDFENQENVIGTLDYLISLGDVVRTESNTYFLKKDIEKKTKFYSKWIGLGIVAVVLIAVLLKVI